MKKNNLIKLLILIFPFCSLTIARSQSKSDDLQLEQMKGDYHKWTDTREKHDYLVEFDPAADAIDIKDPRFSWVVNPEGQGRMQTAYQIRLLLQLNY